MKIPTALLLAYPTAAGRRPSESKARYAEGHFLELADLNWFYDNYTGPTDLDMDFRFAPLAASTLRGLPPTWIALAELDPLRDEGRRLASALRDAQVTTIETEYAGLVHGFLQMGGVVPAAAGAHVDALAFLATSGNRQCDLGYTHMAFEVTEVDAAYGRLTEAGYRTTCPAQKLRAGRTKVIYVLAPERNAAELIEFLAPAVKAETK